MHDQQKVDTLIQSFFEATGKAILFFDRKRRVVAANAAFEKLVGTPRDELLNRRLQFPRRVAAGSLPLLKLARKLRHTGHWRGDIECIMPDQKKIMFHCTVDTMRNTEGQVTGFSVLFLDLTAHYQTLDEMESLAERDALTCILNRYGLEKHCRQLLKDAEQHGSKPVLALLDLDDFKPVNDGFGHQMGDQVLSTIAARLSSVVQQDDRVARLGGDEFVVVFSDIQNREALLQYANELIDVVAQPLVLQGQSDRLCDACVEVCIGASIGLSCFPDHGRTLDELLHAADQAMYQAKRQGKKQIHLAGRPDIPVTGPN